MNIVLISGNFLSKKGGISTTLRNFYVKLTELGEHIYIFDNFISEKSGYKIIYTKESFKRILFQGFTFYFFVIYLFFRILLFPSLELKDKTKIAFYYSFYPKDLVNRIKSIKQLILYFKNFKCDIIFCMSSSFPLFYGFILSKLFNKPLVTLAHGDDFIRRYPQNINTILFQNIDKIIVSNMIMKRFFLKVHDINPKKIEIVNREVNIEKISISESKNQLRNKYNIPLNEFIILTVSRMHPRKGIDTVIKAVKMIIEKNPTIPLKYYLIGDGVELKRLKQSVSEQKLENFIKFLGEVDDNIRNQFFKLSDVFILVPDIKKKSIEGFGIVYIEAGYFKLPVIGSRIGGVKIAIEDGKTGFLINPKNVESLKEKILLLYNNKTLSKELGEYGYNRVMQDYNWNKISLIYKQILRKTIEDFQYPQKL